MAGYSKSDILFGSIVALLLSFGLAAKLSIDKDPLRPKSIRHSHNIVASSVLNGLNPAFQPTPAPTLGQEDEDIPMQSNFLAPTHPSSTYNSEDIIDDRRIFVTTVDGRYHLINGNHVEWSSDSMDPTVFAVDSATEEHPRESTYKRVIPDVDGSLLVLTSDGMRKTHNKASNLADKAPYISEDGIAFTSEKSSRVIRVDMANGNIRDFSKKRKGAAASVDEYGSTGAEEEGGGESECSIPFFLARVDYSVSGVDIASGEVFQISYSDVEPLQKPLYDNEPPNSLGNRATTAGGTSSRRDRRAGGGHSRSVLPFADTLAKITGGREDRVEDGSFFGFELHTSPNGELYFTDADGNYLSDLPSANLGSLVKNAYLVQLPKLEEDGETPVRPIANNLRKLNVVRRMNGRSPQARLGSDEFAAALRTDGSVLVQTVEYGTDKGVYAVEIPPTCENCDTEGVEVTLTSNTKNESLLLCPPVGAAAIGSKQNTLCVFVDESATAAATIAGTDLTDLDESGNDRVVTYTHMTPPKAVTAPQLPAMESRTYIGGNPAKGEPAVVLVSSDDEHNESNSSVVIVVPTSVENSTTPCQVYCQCTVKDALDRLATSSADSEEDDECIDMDMCCDPKPLPRSNTEVLSIDDNESTSQDAAKASSSVAGQHRLLPDPYEGRIFKPAITGREPTFAHDVEDQKEARDAVSTVVVRLPLHKKIFRFLVYMTQQQWFLPACLIVIILLVVTVGPSNYFFAGIIESLLGKTLEQDQRRFPVDPSLRQTADQLKIPSSTDLVATSSKNGTTSVGPTTPYTPSAAVVDVEEVDEFGRKITRIGALVVHTEPILGYGSHGTVVFPGSLNGRPVAVKRMLSQFHKSADRYGVSYYCVLTVV